MATIGDRIRNRREELGLSQEELAKRLGYKSRSSINKIELNQRNLTQSKIKSIADALETTPSYIMGWTVNNDKKELTPSESTPQISGIDKEAYDLFAAMSPEKQALALAKLREIAKI